MKKTANTKKTVARFDLFENGELQTTVPTIPDVQLGNVVGGSGPKLPKVMAD